jgi:hypothetical protein
VRLQLTIALALLCAPAIAVAQVEETEPGDGAVDTTVAVYADDDATTVLTSMLDAKVRLPVAAELDAHVLVDAVTSASVDVVSSATERWHENRVEAGAGVVARLAASDLSLSYTHSGENDWQSNTVLIGLARDFAQDNTTLSLGYGFTDNQIGRAYDPMFERDLTQHGGQLGLSQVLDARTVASLSYTFQRSQGYHASPYRYVTTSAGLARPETHPERRLRHAVALRVLRAIGDSASLDGQYRLYLDDWGIASHTVTAVLTRELGESWDLRIRGRGYYQRAADFYREVYDDPMEYMSADRELSTFWDATAGVKLAWHGERLTLDAKVDGTYYRFLDFARLAGRVAVVTSGGLTWTW